MWMPAMQGSGFSNVYGPNNVTTSIASAVPFAQPFMAGGAQSMAQAPVGVAQANAAQANAAQANVAQANTARASNPYIGQTTRGVSANPYMGQSSGSVQFQGAQNALNSMAGLNNPYLTGAINNASSDAIRNYNLAVAPQRERQMQASGSFGNTGVQQMQLEDQRNLQNTLGNIATSARMQDYTQQLGIAENAAARQAGINQFNAQNNLGAQQFNVGARANDLNRNLNAANQVGMFNAGLQQADLARNTNAALGLSTFNAGQANQMGQFNANQANLIGQFNAGQANQMGQFNAGQANQIGQFNAGQTNQMGQFNANLGQQNNQFNANLGQQNNQFNAGQANNMQQFGSAQAQQRNLANAAAMNQNRQFYDTLDYNTYNSNVAQANQAQQNQLAYLNALLGMQGQGYNLANNIYMQPWNMYGQASNIANAFGGQGGVQSQATQGNPLMGAVGGWQMGSAFANAKNPYLDPTYRMPLGGR